MSRLFSMLALALIVLPNIVLARQPLSPGHVSHSSYSPSISKSTEVTSTPEMWFYEQERLRYEDPNTMARARAEYESNQRQARLAALKWYGMSNSRPMVGTDVNAGVFGPKWVGNMPYTNDWSLVSPAPTYARNTPCSTTTGNVHD